MEKLNQCPQCGDFKLDISQFQDKKSGKTIRATDYRDKLVVIRRNLYFITVTSLVMFALSIVWIIYFRYFMPLCDQVCFTRIFIEIFVAVLTINVLIVAFFGEEFNEPGFFSSLVAFGTTGGSYLTLSHFGFWIPTWISVCFVLFVLGVVLQRKYSHGWPKYKPVYNCQSCGYELAWEVGDRLPKIND